MWPNPQVTADLVTFTEESLKGKLHFFLQYAILQLDPGGKRNRKTKILIGKDLRGIRLSTVDWAFIDISTV